MASLPSCYDIERNPVFRGILPAIFRRFSKKLSTSLVVHQKIFYQIIKINKTLLNIFLVHEVLNFLKNDGKMFKYYKCLDDVLMFEKQSLP